MPRYYDEGGIAPIGSSRPVETDPIEVEIPLPEKPKTDQEIARQLEQSAWEFDDTRPVMEKGEFPHVEKKKSLKDRITTDKGEKAGKTEGNPYTLSVLLRKDPDSFANLFGRDDVNRKYQLPPEKLRALLDSLLSSLLTKDRTLRLDRVPVPLAYSIIQMMIKQFPKSDPAQLDKIFDYLLEATEVAPAFENLPAAANMIQLHQNIRRAKGDYFKTHGKEIEVGHRIIGAAAEIVDSQISNLETGEVVSHLKEMIHSSQEVFLLYQHYKKLGYTHAMMLKEFHTMFKYLGAQLKDPQKENPELHKLMGSVRTLQAIIHLSRFFKNRQALMFKLFEEAKEAFGLNEISVEIYGAVQNPGHYDLTEGATLSHLLQLAIPNTDADLAPFDLAQELQDDQKIHIEVMKIKK